MHGVLDAFVRDKEGSLLEIAKPTLIKGMDIFLRIRKKIKPMVNLEATKQTVLTITSSGEE